MGERGGNRGRKEVGFIENLIYIFGRVYLV